MYIIDRSRDLLVFCVLLSAAVSAPAQVSTSAYRVLGQPNLRQNGTNLVQGVELFLPSAVALDVRGGQTHVYISDTRNSRVLAWRDARSYQIGDPPTLVLGQPGPQYTRPLGIGPKGFNAPLGLAVDPRTGNLYVADFGDNRVLRFPSPFENLSRAEPDAVYGQENFTTGAAGTTRNTMNGPRALAFDSGGNLWVADTGNNRVLRYSQSLLDSLRPPDADTVVGQTDFFSGFRNRGATAISASGFDAPAGLVFDAQDNLYVSDFNNARILKFSAPLGPSTVDPAASSVIGQPNFTTRGTPAQVSSSSLAGPIGLSVDNSGNLYVADPNNNRVLVFALNAISSGARSVLGQSDFVTTTANVGLFPRSSPNTLAGAVDVKVDPGGNVYVADTSNNRVLSFPAGSKSAAQVWGQSDFSGNGPNQVKPGGLNSPSAIAVDYSQAPYALYVSDTANHRILGWRDAVRFRDGDPADFVIGQPDLRTGISNVDTRGALATSNTSLSFPTGIAVQANTGALFVADSGNNRVLRFPRPVNQGGRIAADAVIGQVDFTSSISAVVSASSFQSPQGLAFGPDGNLFVADAGNNRVLEFGSISRPSVRVYGQPNFTSSVASSQISAQTLTAPRGIFVDGAFNLYVADTGSNRVLIFPNTQAAPPAGMAAAFVIGQARFDSTTGGGGGTTFRAPTDVSVDKSAHIYVADGGNNRVLEFPSFVFLPVTGAAASTVVGQRDVSGAVVNWNSLDGLATSEGLSSPSGIYLDRQATLYVADTGNSRVLHFLKPASVVSAATYQASVPVAQGSLAALFGTGLTPTAADTDVATAAPWPSTLLNRQIAVNDQTLAPIYFIGPTQMNFQLPTLAATGLNRIAVRLADTGELVAGGTVLVASNSPGLFTVSQNGQGQAAVLNQDNRLNAASNPAQRGTVISLYGTGQGQVSPLIPDGTAASSNPLSSTVAVPTSDATTCVTSQPSMCVAIGSTFGEIQYSGLAPGFVGLWQINVRIPQGVTPGNAVGVRVVINGAPSNQVTVAIQ